MKIIALNSLNSPSFKSRNPDIKKADNILRETKREFPAFAPNYAYYYYDSTKKGAKYSDRAIPLLSSLLQKHYNLVRKSNIEQIPILDQMESMRKYKLAQCWEKMLAVLAVNSRNGNKSLPVSLSIKFQLKNKETGEIEREKVASLDHDLVLSNMQNDDRAKISDFIVIDPWLDFASSSSEAVAKYKSAFRIQIAAERKKFLSPLPEHPEKYILLENLGFRTINFTETEKMQIRNYFTQA